jgi:glycine cleavage system regulatory protein
MSKTSLVLTILGADRPGLVEAIAQAVADQGGNWVESRMAHLAGQFAGILRVEVDAQQAGPLQQALAALADLQSTIQTETRAPDPAPQTVVQLSLVGQDRPGIVREISRVLASQGVNVEELNTKCTRAATTGQSLFQVEAQLRLPEGMSVDTLRAALEGVTSDLMVDIALE